MTSDLQHSGLSIFSEHALHYRFGTVCLQGLLASTPRNANAGLVRLMV